MCCTCVVDQFGQGQVKQYQAAKHAVYINHFGCQSWCHGLDVTAQLLGQVHMGFAMIARMPQLHKLKMTKRTTTPLQLLKKVSEMQEYHPNIYILVNSRDVHLTCSPSMLY